MTAVGADPTGHDDVAPVIQSEIASNTVLYFPRGTYRLNSQIRRTDITNVGIVGDGARLKHGTVTDIHGFDVYGGEFSGPAQCSRWGQATIR